MARMSNGPAQSRHLQAALYIPATQRADCCARCKYSDAGSGGKLVCRQHGSAEVAAMAVCALWQPISRRIPARHGNPAANEAVN